MLPQPITLSLLRLRTSFWKIFFGCAGHAKRHFTSESWASCAGFAALLCLKLSWLSNTSTTKRPIPALDTYGTWHYIGILSEFIPAKGDATTGSGNRIDVISNIEQQFDTKSGFICAQILNLTWPVPKSVQEETRETSNNPHFYQVWSGLIWNTCKIHLKTRSVTDPIVGGLRREKNTHKWSIWLVRHKPLSKWLVLLWANHRKA